MSHLVFRTGKVAAVRWRGLLTVFLLLFGAACSPREFAEALVPDAHMQLHRGLAYGPDARQRLDVYRPRRAQAPAPAVVFLYGGRWREGSRDDYRLLGTALTRQGIVTVVPDYRLFPDTTFPGWVADAAHAVRWTREHVRQYGGDPGRIFVMGHSAGGHTAALLALDEHFLRDAGVPDGTVNGFVILAGPVDTVWTAPDVQQVMGPREQWSRTYPTTFLDGTEPPLLLLHGAEDETVRPGNSMHFAARVQQAGGCARAVLYPGLGHVRLVVALAAPWLGSASVLRDVSRFVDNPHRICEPAAQALGSNAPVEPAP